MPIFNTSNKSFSWLFAELLVVVLGILIAFQVEEWRTNLSDRQQERAVLENILADLRNEKPLLLEYRDAAHSARTAGIELREYLEAASPRDESTLRPLITGARQFFNWNKSSPSYFGWANSNQPGLISDTALRQQLYLYHEILLAYLVDRTDILNEYRQAYLEVVYLDIEFPMHINESTGEGRIMSRLIPPLDAIPRDPRFNSYLNRLITANHGVFDALEIRSRLGGVSPDAGEGILAEGDKLMQQISDHLSTL